MTKFTAAIDDRVIRAVVKEKGEARQDYEDALEAGNGAYLAEQQRHDLFRISLGNLPSEKLVRIESFYVTPLEVGDDTVAFCLPTKISPRYETLKMAHDRIMDDGVIIEMNATMSSAIVKVKSPSHDIDISSNSDLNSGFSNVIVTDENPLVRDLVIRIETRNTTSPKLFIEHSELYSSTAMLLSFVPLTPIVDETVVKNYEFIL